MHLKLIFRFSVGHFFLVEATFSFRFLICFFTFDLRLSAFSAFRAFFRSFLLLGDSFLGLCESLNLEASSSSEFVDVESRSLFTDFSSSSSSSSLQKGKQDLKKIHDCKQELSKIRFFSPILLRVFFKVNLEAFKVLLRLFQTVSIQSVIL